MSFKASYQNSHDYRERKNLIAMEDFCQLMDSPMLFQQKSVHHHQPHLSFSDSFGSRPESQPQLSFSDSFGSRAHHGPEPQPLLPFSDSFGGRAHHRPEPQPQLSFSNSFESRSHHRPEAQPQLSFSNSFGHVQGIPEPQPQLSFSNSFGHLQGIPESRHHLHHQQRQLSLGDSFGHTQHLPEARYSKVEFTETDILTEPIKRGEKQYSIREASVDKEAGDFIKMKHKKFNLNH